MRKGLFFELPRELRDEIYTYSSVPDSNVSALLTLRSVSHQCNKEVSQFLILCAILKKSFPKQCYEEYRKILEKRKVNNLRLQKRHHEDFAHDQFLLMLQPFLWIYKQQEIVPQKNTYPIREISRKAHQKYTVYGEFILASLIDANSPVSRIMGLYTEQSRIIYVKIFSKRCEETALYALQSEHILNILRQSNIVTCTDPLAEIILSFPKASQFAISQSFFHEYYRDKPDLWNKMITNAARTKDASKSKPFLSGHT